jgi:hypothetical protein
MVPHACAWEAEGAQAVPTWDRAARATSGRATFAWEPEGARTVPARGHAARAMFGRHGPPLE